jgi:DNA-binding transcriptional MocR family regulator
MFSLLNFMGEILKLGSVTLFPSDIEDWISFQYGAPDASLLPCDLMLSSATEQLGSKMAWTGLQYGPVLGDERFREELAKFLSKEYGSTVSPCNLAINNGASQSFFNILTLFSNSETIFFVENPTYFLALKMLADHGIESDRIVPIPIENDGPVLSAIQEYFNQQTTKLVTETATGLLKFPFLFYTIPTFSNPTGRVMSIEKRMDLLRLARSNNILVVCDDVYELLGFHHDSQRKPDRLVFLDLLSISEDGGNVISNCSFSKILAPGARVGWVETSPRLISCLKKASVFYSGGCPSHFMSTAILPALRDGKLEEHLRMLRKTYGARCKVMCDTLLAELPVGCSFEIPMGGFFVWLQVNFRDGIDSQAVLESLNFPSNTLVPNKERVSFTPGNSFSCDKSHGKFIRLSFAMYEEQEIILGCKRLCAVLKQCI